MDIRKDGMHLMAKVYGNREALKSTGPITSLMAQALQMIREAKSGEITIRISPNPIHDDDLQLLQRDLEVEAMLSRLPIDDEEAPEVDETTQRWIDDQRAQKFRMMNSSQRQFDLCDKGEYATLEQYCREHFQGFVENMRLRS